MPKRNNRATEEMTDVMKLWNIEYTWLDKLLHPFIWVWVRIEDAWRNFRYRCQRFKKGYSDRDVWEMRDWFIQTAKPMLRELSAKAYNYPAEVGEAQWRTLLLEMADLLEVMDVWGDDGSENVGGRISAEKENAKNRFFFLFSKYFYDLWY